VIQAVSKLFADGGAVMWPLTFCAAGLWYCLAARWLILRDNFYTGIEILEGENRQILINTKKDLAGQFSTVINSFVALAPLLGLLGTVMGMIETFSSLGDMSLYSKSGGIAGGISSALITTQMGLAVAIPGLVCGRLLARKERVISERLISLGEGACQ
jgi:biopolymer transport protein ExbB